MNAGLMRRLRPYMLALDQWFKGTDCRQWLSSECNAIADIGSFGFVSESLQRHVPQVMVSGTGGLQSKQCAVINDCFASAAASAGAVGMLLLTALGRQVSHPFIIRSEN
eukprot:scaffold135602_cov19-Prasinocladus_malaysianus.AAC.1